MNIFAQKQADKSSDDINPIIAQTYVRLFGFFPVLKIEIRKRHKTFFLFYVLPVFKSKNKAEGDF